MSGAQSPRGRRDGASDATPLVGGRRPRTDSGRAGNRQPQTTPLVGGRNAHPQDSRNPQPHRSNQAHRAPQAQRPVPQPSRTPYLSHGSSVYRQQRRQRVIVFAVAIVAVVCLGLGIGACRSEDGLETEPDAVVETAGDETTEAEGEQAEPKQLVTATYDSGIQLSALEGVEQTEAFLSLETAVAALNKQGIKVGLYLQDLSTEDAIRLRADETFYPASSIKIAASTMAMETDGGAAVGTGTVQSCLVYSDNAAYARIVSTYGRGNLIQWLTDNGAPEAAATVVDDYPWISPSELGAVWTSAEKFLQTGTDASQTLGEYLAETEYSVAGELLRSDTVTVQSKPGWYPADSYDCSATNDAGVVTKSDGSYVFVVMTDANEDFEAIKPLVSALDAVHDEMVAARAEQEATAATS